MENGQIQAQLEAHRERRRCAMAEAKKVVSTEDKAKKAALREEAHLAKIKEGIKKYDHALVDSMEYDPEKLKYKVNIKCTECGNEDRTVYTSDLWQVKMCTDCVVKAKRDAALAAKEAKAAAKPAKPAKIAKPKADEKVEKVDQKVA